MREIVVAPIEPDRNGLTMPELPDIVVYIEALRERVEGEVLTRARVKHPFLVRTFDPPIAECHGKRVRGFRRLGKRIVFELEEDIFLILHLMIAGRLHWKPADAKLPGKLGLAAFDFPKGTLTLTEAGSKRRASIHVVRGEKGLALHQPGGLEVLDADLESFRAVLRAHNHTLKRTLTDPHLFSGIGNSYSDEILHRAQLSPLTWTSRLSDAEIAKLFIATQTTLTEWTELLSQDRAGKFPEKVTAFRKEMAVHGRFRQPCPVCGSSVERIVYAENETNYCPTCQTGGKVLADRALSRLLREDWPRTIEELESLREPK